MRHPWPQRWSAASSSKPAGLPTASLVDEIVPEAADAYGEARAASASAWAKCGAIWDRRKTPEGITAATAESILSGLGCGLAKSGDERWDVTLPSWRLDLEREIDLIEEIARVYGYNRFRNTLPSFAGTVVELPWAEKEAAVRSTLLALGWNEAISSTFCGAEDADLFVREPQSAVALANPLSEEAGMLRPSLLPGMLGMLALNISRDVEGAALFEMGTVFSGSPGAGGRAAVSGDWRHGARFR